MKTTAIGYLNKVSKIPGSNTEVAEVSLLCGKDRGDKPRYLNGSFIVTSKTGGIREADLLQKEAGKSLMVSVEISDLHAEASEAKEGGKIYINYRGLLNNIEQYTPKQK